MSAAGVFPSWSVSANEYRIVMRADATHRLLLNATLFPAFVINLSQDKFVSFVIFEGSDPISYMVRVSLVSLFSFTFGLC